MTQERAEQAEQEIERLRAETDRVRVEAEQVRTQADQLRSGSEEMERGLAEADERHRAELAAADERHRAELAAAADGHGRELATATEQHQRRLAEMQEQHRAEVEELRAQLGERPDVDEILRASQERLATQTERLVEIEERAHRAERELGQSLARQEEVESELRHLQMEKAMRDLRDQEAAEAAAAAAAAHPIVEAEAGPIEDRRASTPFTKELSLDAKKTLSQIMGVTQVLKYKKDGKDQTQLIKQLTASVRRLEHTVSDLADIDSLVRGSVELSIRRADLEALVRRVAEESGVGQDHDLRVEADPVVVGIDPQRTEQIVSGLLRASGERTAIGKQITLRLTARDGGALIAVEDPETSSDASLSPVVKRFAEVQGGWAGVQSREEGGSRFQVFLPDGGPNGEAARPRETGEEAGVELGVESPGDLQIMVNAPRPPDEPWTGNPNEELLVQELHHLSADD